MEASFTVSLCNYVTFTAVFIERALFKKTFLEHNYKCLYTCTVLYLHQQVSVASVKKTGL